MYLGDQGVSWTNVQPSTFSEPWTLINERPAARGGSWSTVFWFSSSRQKNNNQSIINWSQKLHWQFDVLILAVKQAVTSMLNLRLLVIFFKPGGRLMTDEDNNRTAPKNGQKRGWKFGFEKDCWLTTSSDSSRNAKRPKRQARIKTWFWDPKLELGSPFSTFDLDPPGSCQVTLGGFFHFFPPSSWVLLGSLSNAPSETLQWFCRKIHPKNNPIGCFYTKLGGAFFQLFFQNSQGESHFWVCFLDFCWKSTGGSLFFSPGRILLGGLDFMVKIKVKFIYLSIET